MGVGVFRGSWRVIPSSLLVSRASPNSTFGGGGSPAKPLTDNGTDPRPFKPVASRTGIPSMWATACQMYRRLSGLWQLPVIKATIFNSPEWLPEWPRIQVSYLQEAPPQSLPHCWRGHASSSQAGPVHLAAIWSSPGIPSFLWSPSLVSQETWSFKNSTEASQARSRLSTQQDRTRIPHFLSHFLGSCVENNSQNRLLTLGLNSAWCTNLGPIRALPCRFAIPCTVLKPAPGTFPVLGTAAPVWGTLLPLDPIGRCPVAVGNFQMTLFL